jgi:transposase InsO family protein
MDDKLPEQVALFRHGVISELVNRTLSPGELETLLTRIATTVWTIPGTSRTHVGRSTARDWVALYRRCGFEGLKPSVRSDAGQSRSIPEEVQEQLIALRKERKGASVESVIAALHLAGKVPEGVTLRRSSVYRLLTAVAPAALPSPSGEPDALAFTFPRANDLWTSDLMHGPRLVVPGRRDGGKTYLYAFLDDATRMVPFAGFYGAENAACFQEALKQALLRRGLAKRLYCDNGATFRTHHLQVICATLNIVLVHSRPHHPRGRGKIERFFRHVRSAFLPHVTPEQLRELASLNRVFWAWLEAEYHQTPHSGLCGKSPLERFLEDETLIRPAPESLEDLMRMKVARRVGKDRVVHLDGRLYEAPDGFASETVEVLYDPYDHVRPAHFRRKGEKKEIPLVRLDLHLNATRPRHKRAQQPEAPDKPTGISYLDLLARKHYTGNGEN